MSKLTRLASALSFAHLAGVVGVKSSHAAVEDDDDKKESKKGRSAENDDDDDESKKDAGKNRSADDSSDDGDGKKGKKSDADDKGDSEEDTKGKSEKKGKASKSDADADDADDDDEEEMRGKSAAASARRRERARCAAIFGSRAAAGNPVLAANLAFNTSMSRQEALSVLEGTPAAVQTGAGNRAANNPQLGIGEAPTRASAAQTADSWDRVMAQVNPR